MPIQLDCKIVTKMWTVLLAFDCKLPISINVFRINIWETLFSGEVQRHKLTDPKVVEVSDDLLELDWDVDVDVLVETRLNGTERRQGREIVGANWNEK